MLELIKEIVIKRGGEVRISGDASLYPAIRIRAYVLISDERFYNEKFISEQEYNSALMLELYCQEMLAEFKKTFEKEKEIS